MPAIGIIAPIIKAHRQRRRLINATRAPVTIILVSTYRLLGLRDKISDHA
jgi:hypothetical protein